MDSINLADGWDNMLDMQFTKWDKFIGVPHYTVDLPGYPKGDGMTGTPLGLNNDPLSVFSMTMEDGHPVLAISGEIYGGLTTKKEYSNYHLKTEFKWGEKKYEPRLTQKRDNGILYHAYGPHGRFWNVWMTSNELQVQEGDMADYISLGPLVQIPADRRPDGAETDWIYDPVFALKYFGDSLDASRCRRSSENELPHGAWNTLEIICVGNKSIHVVNGKVVNRIENAMVRQDNGSFTALTKGRIQIQSEGAEAYYRKMQIKAISEIPSQYQ